MQILILGMHRSGTSLIARMVNMLGAYFGPEGSSLGCGTDNPRGYWERRDVWQVNDQLLALHGCTWDRVSGWPDTHSPADVPVELRNHMRNIVSNMDMHRPWLMKDPRMCLTLPYWKRWLTVPVGVIAYRHPASVASSLQRRSGMTLESGVALWEVYVEALLRHAQMPHIHVAYDDVTNEPIRIVRQLKEALEREGVTGLRQPSDREVRASVDAPAPPSRVPIVFSDKQLRLDAALRGTAGPDLHISLH